MKKLLFSILLMSGLLLSFGMAASAAEYKVTSEDELFNKVPYGTDSDPVIEIIGEIEIKNHDFFGADLGEHITLKGSGALIFADGSYVDTNILGKLTLAGDVSIYTVDGLAVGWNTATLELKDNAKIICDNGSIPAIYTNRGTLTISDNASVSGGKYGVYCNDLGTINMSGGSISGNEAGVFIENVFGNTTARFEMSGGSVTGGECGVDISVGEFNMTGGSITGCGASGLVNKATAKINGGLIYNNANQNGGADIENHGSLELGAAAIGQKLSCGHKIDGWYDDSPGARWSCESYTPVEPGTYTGDMYLIAAHGYIPPASSVPATADNSNMPLWIGLFIAFAVLALASGKKRRA